MGKSISLLSNNEVEVVDSEYCVLLLKHYYFVKIFIHTTYEFLKSNWFLSFEILMVVSKFFIEH